VHLQNFVGLVQLLFGNLNGLLLGIGLLDVLVIGEQGSGEVLLDVARMAPLGML
jgi:hypothetical protein